MTKEEFQRAREICEKAPKGPWYVDDEVFGQCGVLEIYYTDDEAAMSVVEDLDAGNFAAESRTLLPKALDRIEELEREVEALRQYGNKDCTAQADEYLEQLRREGGRNDGLGV